MISIILGILVVLFCISLIQVIYNYTVMSTHVTKLPSVMQRYGKANVVYDGKVALVSFVTGVGLLLLVLACPITYVLACINALVFKTYLYGRGVVSTVLKHFMK